LTTEFEFNPARGVTEKATAEKAVLGSTSNTPSTRYGNESSTDPGVSSSNYDSGTSLRFLIWVGLAAGALQAVILIVYSAHLFAHFDLTLDFAVENQAWSRITHGDLNPYLTLNPHNYPHYGYPYWQDHLELITWPLALLGLFSTSSFTLLVVQDLALAACTVVVALFARDILVSAVHPQDDEGAGRADLRRSGWVRAWDRAWAPALGLGAIALALINPWTYWSAAFDFHIQALATLFALLIARDLWNGHFRRVFCWIVLLLLCGNVAGTYLVGIGVFALLSFRRQELRRPGVLLVLGGILAPALISAIGGGEGTLISNYAYLAHVKPGTTAGTGAIVVGIVTHPGTPFHMVWTRAHLLYLQLASGGLVGVLSPLGFGMSLVVLLENALNDSPVFSSQISAFQSLPVYMFVLVGSVVVLMWLSRIRWSGRRLTASVVALAVLIQAVVLAAVWIPRASQQFAVVDGATAATLNEVQPKIPQGAEVIVSQGVIGRFANRRLVFPFLDINNGGQVVPVFGRGPVVVLLTNAGIEFATPAGTATAVHYLRSIHAHPIESKNGVYAFVVYPSVEAKRIVFPNTPG
jgi:uncharacterized membrane protein